MPGRRSPSAPAVAERTSSSPPTIAPRHDAPSPPNSSSRSPRERGRLCPTLKARTSGARRWKLVTGAPVTDSMVTGSPVTDAVPQAGRDGLVLLRRIGSSWPPRRG
ncbi:hypothetical protein HT134_09175 [Nonomuraea rhodomycinica]|uniref:Uncharacterized protein n=1 Tax=Nonomuraea rhodomycinica TaxID=1712872 RepID=A0A7Y6IL78_9ACTN|nr:hypothetical protein [Nonomuraea rhodomycinica]